MTEFYRARIVIDHLHYDVKAQRLLVVVVRFAGNYQACLLKKIVMEVK